MKSGILGINKDSGMTSFDVVRRIKKIIGIKKIGHGGTLDPMATGVLPILVNEATAFFDVLLQARKSYQMTVQLGVSTDTDDKDGKIVSEKSVNTLSLSQILNKTVLLTGEILQKPPQFSALKVNGKRAYDLSRSGYVVDLKPRKVMVYAWDKVVYNMQAQTITAVIHCGSGTYIRSLAKDLAIMLGTVGHLVDLHRIASGGITIEDTISLEQLTECWESHVIVPEKAFLWIESVDWNGTIEHLRCGRPITQEFCTYPQQEGLVKLLFNNKIVALLCYQNGRLHYRKNLSQFYTESC